MRIFLYISSLFISFTAIAGNADSLTGLLKTEKTDSVRIRLMLEAGDAYEVQYPDSQLIYYTNAEKLSYSLAEKGFRYKSLYSASLNSKGIYYAGKGDMEKAMGYFNLSLKSGKELMEMSDAEAVKEGQKNVAASLLNTGIIHYYKSDFSGAINDYMAALYIKKILDDNNGIALCINNIGLVYMAQGLYEMAMLNFQEAVGKWSRLIGARDEKKSSEISKRISMGYLNMGIIQRNLKNYEKAIDYYLQALDIRKKLNDPMALSECYMNMGIAYRHLGEYDKSFLYYDKALYVFEKLGDKKAIMRTNNNIGVLLTQNKEWVKALGYYETAMKYAEESGDRSAVANISNNVAELYLSQKNYALALKMGQKALEISDTVGSLPEMVRAYYQIMESYAATGNYKEAYLNAKDHMLFKDSLQGTEKMKAVQELDARYQAEKKQQEIEKQRLVIRKNEEEIKRKDAEAALQRILLISLTAGLLLMLILAWFIYRGYVTKKKAHRDISIKNSQLEQANTEIQSQRDEISAQRDAIHTQKKHIQKILDEHIDSIRYAQRIQKALIPARDILDEFILDGNGCVSEYTIYFKPKDIVSGDFYWATKIGDRLIFCVADCTGHGVPGAFMSMLGVSYLNEITKRHNILSAADILNELRASIVVSLRQQKAEDGSLVKEFDPEMPMHRDALHEVKDGMDIAMCVLNTKTKELQFAGANNSIYIAKFAVSHWPVAMEKKPKASEGLPLADVKPAARSLTLEDSDQLVELKGDKMPIGVYLRMQPFGMQTVQLAKGDVIYLTSDGFTDQFGGGDYKKFNTKRFRKMLQSNAHEPVQKQKEIMDKTFNDWKAGYQQLDDICIMALRIG